MVFTNFNIFYKKNTIPAPNVEIEVFYSDTFNIETIYTFIFSIQPTAICVFYVIALRRLPTVWNSPINITLGGNCVVHGSFHMARSVKLPILHTTGIPF